MKKQKKISLHEFLNSLKSYELAYADTYASGTRRKKCWSQLTTRDLNKLVRTFGNHRAIEKINNNWEWNTQNPYGSFTTVCFTIHADRPFSQIFVKI